MTCTVRIDKQSCLSSGRCVAAEPAAFGWDEDHLSDARAGASALPRDRLVEIARACPSLAITILDESQNEIAP